MKFHLEIYVSSRTIEYDYTTDENGYYDLYLTLAANDVGSTYAVARHPAVTGIPFSVVYYQVLGLALSPSRYSNPLVTFIDGDANTNSKVISLTNLLDEIIDIYSVTVTKKSNSSNLVAVKVLSPNELFPFSKEFLTGNALPLIFLIKLPLSCCQFNWSRGTYPNRSYHINFIRRFNFYFYYSRFS